MRTYKRYEQLDSDTIIKDTEFSDKCSVTGKLQQTANMHE